MERLQEIKINKNKSKQNARDKEQL